MNDNQQLIDRIIKYIRTNPGTSFVEIERIFEQSGFDYKGDLAPILGEQYPNVILWAGWNKHAVDIINKVVGSGTVQRVPCEPLIYMIDGKMMKFPIQRGYKNNKYPHWLPCVFTAKATQLLP